MNKEPTSRANRATLIDDAIHATSTLMRELGLEEFERGPVEAYVRGFTMLNDGFTLWPVIDGSHLVETVVLKNLYGLWAVAVDDALDCKGSLTELADSAITLMGPGKPRTTGGRILHRMMERAGRLGSDLLPLKVGMSEFITAFLYEHACAVNPSLAESERCYWHRTITWSIDPSLAIDVLASYDGALSQPQIRTTSRIYRELSRALRLSQDVGSLDRDRHQGALNTIDVWRLNGSTASDAQLAERARKQADRHLDRARQLALASRVPGVANVVEHVRRTTSVLFQHDLVGTAEAWRALVTAE
jgi:hypothetical protein